MKKNKITILILGIVGVLIFGNQIALAQDSPSVFVSPANLTKNVGEDFDLAIKVNPAGQKVCAVEGQLVLSKLTVQEIKVADGKDVDLKGYDLIVVALGTEPRKGILERISREADKKTYAP